VASWAASGCREWRSSIVTPPRAITFDFHDTVAIAPRWFQLEIRALPTAVLAVLNDTGVVAWDHARDDEVTAAYRAMRATVAETGLERVALDGTQHALQAVGIVLPDATVASVIDRIMADAVAEARPRPGIQDTVWMLANLRVPLGVISSAVYHPFLEWCLEAWGLREHFATVVTSASCGFYKSHPGIYQCALDALNVAPQEAVHVGDSYLYDVQAAHAIGMRTVWLNLKGEERADNLADFTVPDLVGLVPKLWEMA